MIPRNDLRKCHGRMGWAILIAFTLVLAAPSSVHAQVESGSIVGTVRDSSGAVAVGASVTWDAAIGKLPMANAQRATDHFFKRLPLKVQVDVAILDACHVQQIGH